MNYGLIAGVIFAVFSSGTVLAQNTLGELLAAGGKQLSKDETLATLRGASVSGPTATGGETQVDWKENGSVSGYMTNATGTRGGIVGTWRVDDARQGVSRDRITLQGDHAGEGLLSSLSPCGSDLFSRHWFH